MISKVNHKNIILLSCHLILIFCISYVFNEPCNMNYSNDMIEQLMSYQYHLFINLGNHYKR